MNQSYERCKHFELWYTFIVQFVCVAVRSTRFRVILLWPLHSPSSLNLSSCSYSFSHTTLCRLSTDIWPMGSIIKNLNVSINRHNNMAHKITYTYTANRNEIDVLIKLMPNDFLLRNSYFNQIIQKQANEQTKKKAIKIYKHIWINLGNRQIRTIFKWMCR